MVQRWNHVTAIGCPPQQVVQLSSSKKQYRSTYRNILSSRPQHVVSFRFVSLGLLSPIVPHAWTWWFIWVRVPTDIICATNPWLWHAIAFATRGSSWSRQAQVRVDKTIQLEKTVHVVQNRGCLGGSRIPTCSHALRSLCSSRIYTCGVVLSVVTMARSTMHLGLHAGNNVV